MIKTNIKMRVTPEQSKKVQEICFGNGIEWADTGDNYIKHNMFVGVYLEHKTLWGVLSIAMLNDVEYKEIDADLFIKTNGTCEETFESLCNDFINENMKPSKSLQSYNEKYTSQPKDLESALKKIENLHIALNKKVEKNKNQALEITKLLEQKKLLKKEISYKQNNDNGLRSLLKEAQEALDDLNKTIDLLEDRIKEKDTIILYLESKLK